MNEQGSTSSAASCANGHVFIYAGDISMMQDGYPCVCGMTKYRASTNEVHIYSIEDLFAGDLSNKTLIVHSKAAKEYLENHPMYGEPIFATNDPQAAYGKKREPMFGEEQIDALWDFDDPPGTVAKKVSAHYESLIASGELIVKSELILWLEQQRDERLSAAALYAQQGSDRAFDVASGKRISYEEVLDHLNGKKS